MYWQYHIIHIFSIEFKHYNENNILITHKFHVQINSLI